MALYVVSWFIFAKYWHTHNGLSFAFAFPYIYPLFEIDWWKLHFIAGPFGLTYLLFWAFSFLWSSFSLFTWSGPFNFQIKTLAIICLYKASLYDQFFSFLILKKTYLACTESNCIVLNVERLEIWHVCINGRQLKCRYASGMLSIEIKATWDLFERGILLWQPSSTTIWPWNLSGELKRKIVRFPAPEWMRLLGWCQNDFTGWENSGVF